MSSTHLQAMPLTLAAWFHTLSPFLIRFTDSLGIRWYGLAYASGFVIGWLMLRYFSKRGLTPLSVQRTGDAMLALVMGVVLGGRLGYVLFYKPVLLWTFWASAPWWGVLRLNEGGMSSHGGMLGVLAATWFIARGPRDELGQYSQRVPWPHVMDLTALVCTPGLLLGRLANFINGELLGEIVAQPGQPAPWWSVKFPQEAFTDQAPIGQAAQIRPMLEPYRLMGEPDEVAYQRLVGFIQSGKQGAAEAAHKLEPLISARHPSQLYQGFAEGIVVGTLLWLIWRKPRKPGVLTAFFLIFYGILPHIFTELIRLPDTNLEIKRFVGLSRGQWLSVVMIVAGLLTLAWTRRSSRARYGGWGVRRNPQTPNQSTAT